MLGDKRAFSYSPEDHAFNLCVAKGAWQQGGCGSGSEAWKETLMDRAFLNEGRCETGVVEDLLRKIVKSRAGFPREPEKGLVVK